MGNQQSLDGLQFCSTRPHSLANRFMAYKDFRVDHITSEKPHPKVTRFSKQQQIREGHQQPMRDSDFYHQKQESVDVSSKSLVASKSPEIDLIAQEEQNMSDNGECKSIASVYEGIFSDISILSDGVVEYTDSGGNNFHEKYNLRTLQKTFPMGISFGELSMSLWFKNVEDRDECASTMTGNLPPSYTAVMDNPEYYKVPELQDDKRSMKVFDGIRGNVVVLYSNNYVDYTDLDGAKHYVSYNKNKIRKCFPQGICFGGLDRTLWLSDENERDLCFTAMQLFQDESRNKEEEKSFPGLYGNVSLKGDQLSFTSLVGERIKVPWYDTKSIFRVFPLGLSGGGLPHSIWFEKMEDLENCFTAMEQRCH